MNWEEKESNVDTSALTDYESGLLKERAKSLAVPFITDSLQQNPIDILEFFLSGERYALPMQYVREVTLLRHLSPLPGTPDFILGIINVRGKIISVTDLRVFFHLPRKGLSDYNKIIILSGKGMEYAVLADQVAGVKSMDLNLLSHPPDILRGMEKDFLSGVFPGPVILINAELLLTDKRLIVQSSAIRI